VDDLYSSPLKELHWLRIIIDEGHEFSSANSNAVVVAQKLVTADRRWVVSGTPARDRLFGVEVDLAADADFDDEYSAYIEEEIAGDSPVTPSTPRSSIDSGRSVRYAALQQRKAFNRQEESSGAAKSIGLLATHFLKARPWWAEDKDRRSDWDDHIYRHEIFRGRTYSGFSKCLRQTLQALVVKVRWTRNFYIFTNILIDPAR
jgi:hypothetical protein